MAAVLYSAPIELSEVGFMLKHGIRSADLAAEVKKRKLVQAPTEAQMSELKNLGASQELLDAVSAPGNLLEAKESEAFFRKKEIEKQEHFWVLGSVNTIKDGRMLVACPGTPAKPTPLPQYVGNVILIGTLPVMFKVSDSQDIRAVNCEARKTGTAPIQNQQNQVETVPVMEVVQDFGKPVVESKHDPTPPPAQFQKKHEAILSEGQWYHLSDEKAVPGGGPNLWVQLITSDQFTVRFLFSPTGPARVPESKFDIKKGTDTTGNNLTLICEDPVWQVFWKDTVGAFPGTGVIVIERK